MNKDFSVILPTYNEEGHIKRLIIDLIKIFKKKKLEIIIVDDNSTDLTISEVKKIKNKNIKIILRKKKKNLVLSLKEGIKLSTGQIIIWMDADYSHPPEYLKNILNKNFFLKRDVIIFSRFLNNSKRYYIIEKTNPKLIDYLSFFLNKICNFLFFNNITDYTSGYICIKKNILKKLFLNGYYGDYFIKVIWDLKKLKSNIIELPYLEKKRASGESKTTNNKIDLIIKCFFYFKMVIILFIKKLIFFFNTSIK